MNESRKNSENLFRMLLEADEKLWGIVLAIEDEGMGEFESFIPQLMQMRGDLHVQFMRPIYKKYPELATEAGLDEV